MDTTTQTQTAQPHKLVKKTLYPILFAVSFSHLLNDLLQSVIPSVYPIIKDKYAFSFTQIGIITFAYQITASLLQPVVGNYTDRNPKPFSLPLAMLFTMSGIVALSFASNFYAFIVAVCLVGLGSSVFHPEATRVAHMASGGKKGLAQSIFQLGGNAGTSVGPLLAALIVIPFGQSSLLWFTVISLAGMALLYRISRWYASHLELRKKSGKGITAEYAPGITKQRAYLSLGILLVLVFSKYIYMTSMTSYFTFYLIDKFHVSVQQSQYYLFCFLAAVAAGTIIGGPIGDRIGRKYIIWISILGVAPFTILLPYANLELTIILAVIIGLILASAFSAIVVYATELMPGKIGTIAGLFYGFMFGVAGIGSAYLGWLADQTGLEFVFKICSFMPFIGVIAFLLPSIKHNATQPTK